MRLQVELGGYVGYSTLLFADAVRSSGGSHYYSLERNPEFAAVITSLIDLAGLRSIASVIVGPSDKSLSRLHADGTFTKIDLMFLDHYKPAYLSDLKLCERLRLVGPGTVLAADNVIKPGNPPYLAYVRSSVEEKRAGSKSAGGFSDRTTKQYEKREGEEKLDEAEGDPNLVYESRLINSFEPTGIPVSMPTSYQGPSTNMYRMVLKSQDAQVERIRYIESIPTRISQHQRDHDCPPHKTIVRPSALTKQASRPVSSIGRA